MRRNILKKVMAICLCFAFIFNSAIVSLAKENDNSNIINEKYLTEEPSETFIDFYSSFFENKEIFQIFDYDGNDITKSFYDATYKFYKNNDYQGLKNYVLNNNVLGGCEERTENIKETRGFKTDSVHKRYFYNVNKHPAAGELEYYINGTYSWDVRTGKIASHTGGSVQITRCNFGALWSHSTDNMTVRATVSNDGYSITFYGSFHLVVTLGISIGKFPVGWKVDCGSYSGSATATGHT